MHPERGSRRRGWLPMQASLEYRRFAQECERLARQAVAPRQRDVLLEMAEAWKRLAAAAENEGTGERP